MNELSYKQRVLNLGVKSYPSRSTAAYHGDFYDAYSEGHKEGRLAAAEIAKEADARIEELEYALRGLLAQFVAGADFPEYDCQKLFDMADAEAVALGTLGEKIPQRY